MYLLVILVGLCAAWLILKQRQLTRNVPVCPDQSYLRMFKSEALASERGKVAEEMSGVNPDVASDREFFINLCYSSGVQPELAASAWVERALDARFRRQRH